MSLDLNQLRATLHDNQNTNNPFPTESGRQVVVGRDGEIKMGNEVRPGEQTTQVPQETFAQ